MEELFQTVASLVRENNDPDSLPASNEEKLRIYGLYKHVVDGPCMGGSLPPVYQVTARAKYQAWDACRSYTSREAMSEYVQLLAARNDRLGTTCKELMDEYLKEEQSEETTLPTKEKSSSSKVLNNVPKKIGGLESLKLLLASWITYLLGLIGVRPLIPRGRLDVSYQDLLFALYQSCIQWRGGLERRCNQTSDRIRNLFMKATGYEAAVGFSVRSLFDLYLCTKNYPAKSEVIVFPPISVPGMLNVAKYHNLRIVAVDIEESQWWNFEGIQEAVNKNTVAIMIVHPFGMVATSNEQLDQIRALADKHSIEVWEDCAECFTGLGSNCYLGSPVADVRFFSFGMIKTATALGGGVAVFRKAEVARQIERLQQSLCKRQSSWEFIRRIILSLLLNFIASSPIRVGLLAAICSIFGLNYDKMVTFAIRGFQVLDIRDKNKQDERLQRHIHDHVRRKPSPALLSLLLRRLQQSITVLPSVPHKLKRCQRLESIFRDSIPEVLPSNPPNVLNTYWAFPIFCKDRELVSHYLQRQGFDIVSWASQLCCVESPSIAGKNDPCPRTRQLMSSVLYLPISSYNIPEDSTKRLVDLLQYITTKAPKLSDSGHKDGTEETRFFIKWHLVTGILVAYLFAAWKSVGWRIFPRIFVVCNLSLLYFGGIIIILGVLLYVLRMCISSLYLNHSSWYEHFDMVDAATADQPVDPNALQEKNHGILSEIQALKLPNVNLISEKSEERKALLTGATGFVGSLLLRDLLYYRQQLSSTRGVIVICRNKGELSAESRIAALLAKPMFNFLSESEKRELVHVIEGDVTKRNLGLSEQSLGCIVEDESISHVFHCAAAVSFTQDLPDAARSNITSTLEVQSLSSRLKNKDVQFVHVSTAFVHGDRSGSLSSPLQEDLFTLDPYDPSELYKSMLGTQFYATKAMTELGFPNTYAFSKCVCEHLLLQRNEGNTLIIRPSIVGPAVVSPFEGWAGGKPSTLVAASMLYLSSSWNIWYLPSEAVAYVPVDVLCRFILAKAYSVDRISHDVDSETTSSSMKFQEVDHISENSSSDSGELISMSSLVTKSSNQQIIFNCTWDMASNDHAKFTWLDFGVAQCHLSVMSGYVTRLASLSALLVAAKVMPLLAPNASFYMRLHALLIQGPISILAAIMERINPSCRDFARLQPFLNLPLLFFPFVKSTFHFQSDLTAPETFDAKRYAFSCGVAAHRFLLKLRSREIFAKSSNTVKREGKTAPKLSMLSIGGRIHKSEYNDMLWVLSQPRGNFLLRFAAFFFTKILRAVSSIVTVDVVSFHKLASFRQTSEDIPRYIILAPTHRSFFDFILLSYAFFALPELQLDAPFIVAADEFERLPFIGLVARLLRAFFIQRGRGYADKDLTTKLAALKADKLSRTGGCLEVFLEGKRSRDRRFASSKTGLLKSLQASGGEHVIVPITINYEALPEQKQLSKEASGAPRRKLNIAGMFEWLLRAAQGKIDIGKIHIVAGDPLLMGCQTSKGFKDIVNQVQTVQQSLICVSDYHVHAASRFFQIDFACTKHAMEKLGCKFWPLLDKTVPIPELPTDESDLCSVAFQFSHQLAPLMYSERKSWSIWMNSVQACKESLIEKSDDSIMPMYTLLGSYFDEADRLVGEALQKLQRKGFFNPKQDHVFQTVLKSSKKVPLLFLHAAVEMKIEDSPNVTNEDTLSHQNFEPHFLESQESLGYWGFHDSGFVLKSRQHGQRLVSMRGKRYGLSGRPLLKLLPFIESELQISIDPLKEFSPVSPVWSQEFDTRLSASEKQVLCDTFGQTSFSTLDRVRHGTGHSQEDIYLIRTGGTFRIPDAVVWPSNEDDVEKLVDLARSNGWCLIPFGGGTNVSDATRCPEEDTESRPIISVDMKQMCRILWVNEEDGLARVEAGMTGRDLVKELGRQGLMMGHEPDSYEFSTLGGWIATKASGMKRSKYGNIEDIVKAVHVVNPEGLLWKGTEDGNITHGRVAESLDLASMVIGSEGCLGIITSAVIRVWPMPETKEYDSIILQSFKEGLQFARAVARLGARMPASVRILDNAHFRLGQALHPEESSIYGRLKEAILRSLSSAALSYDPKEVVCATICYEGTTSEVTEQKRAIREISNSYGGTMLGSKIGKAGYELTFMIAYLRDFAMTYHLLGESFETFVPWSKIENLITATKNRISQEHSSRFLPGVPFVGCRVTQLYHEGACLYFYLCFSFEGVENASQIFSELEKAARCEILAQGGSLSHHHGIGKLRAPLLKERASPAFHKTMNLIKEAVDSDNIFAARNGIFAE